MCGISGIFSYQSDHCSRREFIPFIDSLTHRGPDGRGVVEFSSEKIWLGHRRLKILDLSERGFQPMSYAQGRYYIVFNGEIYNFLELKKELECLGHLFYSDSDTEVILAAYAEWGKNCQFKFNGMWAFAIWDRQTRELFLSRDRFGVKPLYFYHDQERLCFASEVKAFLALPGKRLDIDYEAAAFSIQEPNWAEASGRSLLKGVVSLHAGSCAVCAADGRLLIQRWWKTLEHLRIVPEKESEQVEAFLALFEDACRIRMRSDVPLGSALSGGLDSSSVLATVSKIGNASEISSERRSPNWQSAFSSSYEGTSQDEFRFAQIMAKECGVHLYPSHPSAQEMIQNFEEALYQFEGIFELPIGPWMLYREFRKRGIVISLDGHGADELLGGYHHHAQIALSEAFFPNLQWNLLGEWRTLLLSMYPFGSPSKPSSWKQLIYESFRERALLYSWAQRARKKRALKRRWFKMESPSLYPSFDLWKDCGKLSLGNRVLFRDFHHYTLPTILRNFDRCSMAHGVEVRAPFLDWRLVCFCFSLPASAKINSTMTKRLLRLSMRDRLPDSIRLRSAKVGFANPFMEWLKTDLQPFLFDSMSSDSFLSSPIWDGGKIRSYVARAYKDGDIRAGRMVWEFLQADHLIRLFKTKQQRYTSTGNRLCKDRPA